MKILKKVRKCPSSSGFTLIEVMVSILILVIAITLAWQTFSSAIRAWTGAQKVTETLHQGDFIMEQLSAALRSMAYFPNSAKHYGFRMENNPDGLGEHTISWVTSHQAFMPRGGSFEHGMHRIEIGAGRIDRTEGLVVTVWQHMADKDDVKKESWIISETIQGLSCYVYDQRPGEERWTDEWETTNKIPGLIEITLFAEPYEKYGDPIEFKQLIEIPRGPRTTNEVTISVR
jgi:prepilin-type N-terminal cleavage/methylation domain-containing protein